MLDIWYEAGSPDGSRKEFRFQMANNRINKSDIRDYEWQYSDKFQKVRQFYKELETKSIPITFFQRRSGAENELYTRPEDMYAMFDRDVRMLTMGKLYIGKYDANIDPRKRDAYWINCYVIGSSKKQYNNGKIISMDLKVLSDFKWHKTVYKEFGTAESGGGGGSASEFLDFEYNFEYDYSGSPMEADTRRMASESIAPFDFRIEFQGPVEDPELQVGDQIYRVYTSVGQGETLVIDSVERRVYRIRPDGEVNEFNNRDRDHYIFQPMPVTEGNSEIVWQEGHTVALYAYIERSEPKWI